MNVYPLTAGLRRVERVRIHERAVARAAEYQQAQERLSWSMKCVVDNHAPDGCANDGRSCICECHDPSGETP